MRVTVGPVKAETKVVKKDYNPIFNHPVPPVQLDTYDQGFKFEVFDWDQTGSNDKIGKLQLTVIDLIRLGGPALIQSNTCVMEQVLVFKSPSSIKLRFEITWPVALQAIPPFSRMDFLKKVESNRVFAVLQAWKISPMFSVDLMSLAAYEIVLVLDDSGSMCTSTGKTTRWGELKDVARIAIEIGAALDDNGVDILFLNREGRSNVKSWDEADKLFKASPSGGTPLGEALGKAFSKLSQKPLLVLVATDGVPNNMDVSGIFVLFCFDFLTFLMENSSL